ncbi:MAG TPA: SPOR domain-containing protein [Terriglobales bacterium]|nr:SPOR domain-containing protein [Terriglobales bacterium]
MSVGTRLGIDETGEMADTEITLGTGKLLGMFFALAVVCALFFGLGFNLGRGSAPQPDPNVAAAAPTSTTKGGDSKPSAAHALSSVPCPAGQICSDSAATETTTPSSVPPEGVEVPATTASTAAATSTAPVTQPNSVSEGAQPTTTTGNTTPPNANPAAVSTTTFVVQVAAVSRREDADALTIALRKKSYPAFVVSDLPDKLYHIQVGPFEDRKAAIDARDRLSADGYNPIIK